MKRLTYPKAMAAVLEGIGFERNKDQWFRRSGMFEDNIDFQVGKDLKDITANARLRNFAVEIEISRASPPGEHIGILYPVYRRVPMLIDRHDRWWSRSDPDGPAQMAAAVRDYALPFLERLHSLEALKAYLEETGSIKWRDATSRMYVAIILGLTGRTEEAVEALSDPPRWTSDPWLRTIETLRQRIRDGMVVGGTG